MSFKVNVSLLIFSLSDLSIDVSEALKSPTIIVLLSISHFTSINIWFMYLGAPELDAHLQVLYLLVGLIPLSLCNAFFFVFSDSLCFKVYFV